MLQLWVEYAENKPGAYGYSRYCELYGQWKKKLNPTMRQRHRAGEKTFVDFSGKKPHIVDPKTGELVEMELFVGTLGASSYTYVEATLNQSLESWAKAHKGMSDYFGGSTEIWVPDNLKSGVDLVDRYEPGINRTYEELATHYGAVVVPARVFKPKDKAKVESAVQVAQRWILAVLRHRTFFSLAELNEAIWEKLEVLNARPMQKLGVSRRELYERLDRPVLKPLPQESYELSTWKRCRVNIDYHVEVENNLYSVPYQLIQALLHGPEQIADLPVPVGESPGAVSIGHAERGHLVEYLAPNSVFNSLPRQRSSPHLGPHDRLVTIDRVLHHASLGAA